MVALADWIGRTEDAHDRLSSATVARLAGTLDSPVHDFPLAHWLCYLPTTPQAAMDVDGHPRRGGFLPPVDLPRRMWAGGRLRFHAPLPIDQPLARRSTIADIREKTGSTGRLVFVTVRHEVHAEAGAVVTEEQDLVYREAATGGPPSVPVAAATPRELADVERVVTPDPVLLFRFSALTFNAHRIHYDRDYARAVEGYSGLVVHGPLLATLLADHWLRERPGRTIMRFAFRARKPLVDTQPFSLCLADTQAGARLWVRDADGHVAFDAELDAAR